MFFRNMELNKTVKHYYFGGVDIGGGVEQETIIFKFVVAFNFKNGVYVLL